MIKKLRNYSCKFGKARSWIFRGTAYWPQLDHLSAYYSGNPSKSESLFLLQSAPRDRVIGGVGIAEFNGIENCASFKALFNDSAKGNGYGKERRGKRRIGQGLPVIKSLSWNSHESFWRLWGLYEKMGFRQIEKALFNAARHNDFFYLKAVT